jgi:hypothetical protein
MQQENGSTSVTDIKETTGLHQDTAAATAVAEATQQALPEIGPASAGRVLDMDGMLDFETSGLMVQVFDDSGREPRLVHHYFIVDRLTKEVAERAFSFFVGNSHMLVDVGVLRGEAGWPESPIVKILWTDDLRGQLAESYESGTLRELPEPGILRMAPWALYCEYDACRATSGLHDDDVKALMWLDMPSYRDDAEARLKILGEIAARAHAAEEPEPSFDDPSAEAEEPAPRVQVPVERVSEKVRMVVSPTMKVEEKEGKYATTEWNNLAGPLPLGGPVELRMGKVDSMPAMDELRVLAPWMTEVVDKVEERLWLMKAVGRKYVTLPTMMLYGPSGSGKTYFARRLAKALDVGFAEMSLAGSTDNQEMQGTSKAWSNARPSWPVCSISRLGCANPLLFVDEIDKVDSSYLGDPRRTMLTMMEESTSKAFHDQGLGATCDLSHVSWMLAGNQMQGLDTAFMDRIEVIRIEGPGVEHLPIIVSSVIADYARRMEVEIDVLPSLGDIGMMAVEELFERTKSLRQVSRHVTSTLSRMIIADARKGRMLV